MKSTSFTRTATALSILLMATTSANAQLNSLLNKAKNKVKETVSTKVEEAKTSATKEVVSSSLEDTMTSIESTFDTPKASTTFDAKKTYTPSAEAIAADPKASDQEVKKNYTKSPAAIRGAYEHLDKALFPYQPYYQYSGTGLYLDGTEDVENFVYYMASECKNMINESRSKINGFMHNGTVSLGNTGKCVPWNEIAINAFFAEYFADPESYMAYRQMIKAYIVVQQQFLGRLRLNLDDGSDVTITNKDGKQTLFEPESVRLRRNNDLMGVAFDIAMESSYDNVFDSTYGMLKQANKAYDSGNMVAALNNYNEFVTSFDFFLQKHAGWASDDRANEFKGMYQEARIKMQKAQDAVNEASMVPEPMPKTYNVSAEIQQMAKQVVAVQDPEHKNAPIYFLTNGWRTLTRNGYITHRAIDVAWEYKDANGQRWLNHGVMMQQAQYRGLTVIYLEGKYGMSGYSKIKLK